MNQGAKQNVSLAIGCFNARSLCNKTCGVLELLKDNNISICCVTETWLTSNDKAKFAEIHDLGYDVISAPRKGRGGGVAFLYNPNILNPVRNDVKKYSSFEVIECIIKSANASIRLCVIYRSTRNKEKYEDTKVSKFMTDFEDYLDNLVTKSGSPIICGDFNFHVEDPYDASAQKFIDLYRSKGFAQHVSAPTHISGSTLDLVLTLESVVDPIALQQIVCEPNTGTASDHFLVSFNIPITLNCSNSRTYEEKEVREMGKIDINSFREDIFFSKLNQGNYESVDQAVQLYSDVVGAVLEKHAPLISKKFTTQKSDFWNDKCQAAVRERRRAKRALVKAKTKISIGENIDMEEFENLKINHGEKSIDAEIVINRARTDFYNKQLASLKGDSKGTYKVINKLLDKEYGSNKAPNGDEEEVANRLKTFFDVKVRTIYSNIKNNMTCSPESKEAVGTAADCTLDCFREISVQELEDLIRNLPNKSSPLDTIPLWLFKHCLPELLPIVHYIVNESLKEGYFPAALKEASIRPGLKKPTLDVDELKNYRPISNLTYLSKILEKAVHSQLCSYVDSNNLFSNYQSGYRKFHSCETAVTKIHNDVLMMIDKKENVLLLLLDLSAAFDTINHDLLLKKLTRTYGIRKTAIKWLESYLRNRTFKVTVNNSTSSECVLEIGVPQGSILGPLLFIMYTKDLEKIVTKYGFTVHLYADDTQIYFSFDVHNENPNFEAIKACFQEIKLWMSANYLKLNEEKTELLDIGPYISPVQYLDLGQGILIHPTDKAKNLGFMFDHQLNLDAQINTVSQICYINQRNLYRIGSKLPHELKVQLVYSNILCFLDYCNAVYSRLTESNLQKLQKIQNTAVRFIFGICGKRRNDSISPYLKKLHFLPIRFRIKYKIALLVFKCINNLAPDYLKDLISLREIKRRSSRLDNDFFMLKKPSKCNFSRSDAAFSHSGPEIWNSLPYELRSLSSIDIFKSRLKTHFFNLAFEDVE